MHYCAVSLKISNDLVVTRSLNGLRDNPTGHICDVPLRRSVRGFELNFDFMNGENDGSEVFGSLGR